MRILFIDDSLVAAGAAAETLRADGIVFEQRIVSSFDDATHALRGESWSVVISAYGVGGHDALVLLPVAREQDPDLPFLMLAGAKDAEHAPKAIRAGANDSILKSRMRRLPWAVRRELDAAETRRSRRALESRLREAEERYRETFERAPIGIANADVSGRFFSVNQRFCELLGYEESEVVGHRFVEFGHPGDNIRASECYAAVANGVTPAAHYERRYFRKNADVVWGSVSLAPVLDASGSVDYVIGLVEDITDRKASQEELLRQARLLDCVEQAVIATDREGRVIYWNAFAEKLYGWTTAEVLGRPIVDVTPTPMTRGQAAEILERLKTGESWSGEIELTHRNGTAFPAFITDSPLFDQSGTLIGIVGISYDLTDQKRAEEELRRRSIQQSAVVNLGKIALSGASMTFLLEQAVESIRDVLHLETAAVVEEDRADTGASRTDAKPLDEGDKGISVPILRGSGQVWGHLGGQAKDATSFAHHDVDFLRSVATVISQALERNEAEDALKRRARQQSAIARFGRLVLTSVAADAFERACDLLPLGADVDFGFFAEVTPANTLRLRAGNIWTGQTSGAMPALATLQAGASLIAGEPVVVSDYRTDERFRGHDDAVLYGILSGVMVPVASPERAFGVLSAQSRTADHFRQEDVDFIESVANMLAEALEREIARASVADSEERYRRILDGATEIIFSVDAAGRFTSINPAFETITAWRREEWLGRPFLDILVARDRQRLEMVLGSILDRRETVAEETTIRGRDRDITVEVTAFPKVENGRVVEVYAFARDVTDAHRATAERERVTRSLQLLLESTIEGIYTFDLDGRCTMINRAAAAFLGMSVEEVLGRPMHDLLHRDAEGNAIPVDQCPIEGVLRSGQPRTIADDFFWRGDGHRIPVAYSAAPILDEGVRVGAVVTFTDLRERRKLEAKLEQITRLSSLGHLAATVAHEFNNVLMGISPFVDVVRRAGSRQRVETALDHIANAVKRGQRITGDILRFTQPAEPMRIRIDLAGWLDALAVEARSVLEDRFTVSVSAEPMSIDADPGQIHQTLMNLILNARDAMPSGGTIAIDAKRDTRDARLSAATVENPTHYAHLTVSDKGAGMSEETLRHAFEPLFTTKKSGTGLGLAVAHQVVRLHDGAILAESSPGVGTTFHIYLPLSVGDATVTADAAAERSHKTAARHILLVEDDPIVGAGLCELLEYEGFTVTAVDTGRGAIDAITSGALPDVVILDVGLPDMDGTAVFEEIATLHPEMPVIFSTGHADRARLEDILTRGNVGYLLKPYDSEALMNVLSEVAARRGLSRSSQGLP